ncbi:MAG: hypothetical protein WBE38_03555 [Terracidiphilus sp.]
MKKRLASGIAVLLICLGCATSTASPVSPHCRFIQFCLFNQEAAANDAAGIHKYSEDLIGLIAPNPAGDDSIRQLTDRLAGRLASAEQAARAGDGKLVPETAVVKAFNDLMRGIGAPPSYLASEENLHEFREHAASIKAFPALFSAGRNGANCEPGEAVFLLYQLISANGAPLEGNLDAAVELTQQNGPRNGEGRSFGVAGGDSGPDASALVSSYVSRRNSNAAIALLNHVADVLGL